MHLGRWGKKIENRVRHRTEVPVVSPAKFIFWDIIPLIRLHVSVFTNSWETKLTSEWRTHLKGNKYKDSSENAVPLWPPAWTDERLRTSLTSHSSPFSFAQLLSDTFTYTICLMVTDEREAPANRKSVESVILLCDQK